MIRIWIYISLASFFLAGCEGSEDVDLNLVDSDADVISSANDTGTYQEDIPLWIPTPECTCLVDADCASKMGNVGACYEGVCDPDSCECVIALREPGASCADDDLCTENTICEGNVCGGGDPVLCEDGNICTDDGCDAGSGCWNLANEMVCEDGDLCTDDDVCIAGDCVGLAWIDCGDGSACTMDTCEGETGCVHTSVEGPCDDGNLCSTDDSCVGGVCLGQGNLICDDGNLCTDDSCHESDGCVFTENQAVCEDGDPCTIADYCESGSCLSGLVDECDDQNVCTVDECDALEGCVHEVLSCDDGSECTNDYCDVLLGCILVDIPCEDDNICTEDGCDGESGCEFLPIAGPCDDGEPCTYQDECNDGACTPGDPHPCDDGDECTADSCEWSVGCNHIFTEGSLCDDGNLCTSGDSCVSGGCVGGVAVSCDDGNPCTSSTCVPEAGCVHVANQNACDDGNICTIADQCQGSVCAGTSDLDCDDGNVCTNDGCIPGLGCFYGIVEDVICDDGLACNGEDLCVAGICTGAVCACQSDADCPDDGDLCNGVTGCDQSTGACVTSPPVQCSQEGTGPCEAVFCQPQTGTCVVGIKLNGTPCNDQDLCTVQDICLTGSCVGSGVLCDDDNPCTMDLCDGTTGGCKFAVDEFASCDDGNECTEGESCIAGQCAGGVNICGSSCKDAALLSCGDAWQDIDVADEASQAGTMEEYGCVSSPYPGPEQVYSFIAQADGLVTIYLYDGSVGADLLVLSAETPDANGTSDAGFEPSCDPLACIAFGYEEVSFEAQAGESFFIVVEINGTGEDAFSISASCEEEVGPPCAPSDTPGCNDCECESCVCEIQPKCCTAEWDEACVELCAENCGMDCQPPPAPCCFPHGKGGCQDDNCASCVCSEDSYCCNAAWDLNCVVIADESCDEACECPVGVGSCCESLDGKGCENTSCQACVCDVDPYCCLTQWDVLCANASYQDCASFCACAETGLGDCCEAQGTAGCMNHACEQCVCEQDSFCCAITWDGLCVEQAMSDCDDECDCQSVDCCQAQATSGCGEDSCSACVCDTKPSCCESGGWTMGCALAAQAECSAVCGCAGTQGVDCCVSNGTPGCSDLDCQDCVCEEDDFCCEAAWDMVCAGAAAAECADECVCVAAMSND